MTKLPKRKNERLAKGEYLISDPVVARLLLIRSTRTVLPEFFEELRKHVYPLFAPIAQQWREGEEIPSFRSLPDHESRLREVLLKWAQAFNSEDDWILEGAVSLLWHWHRYPKWREALCVEGFMPDVSAAWSLVTESERQFVFQHAGWNPQFQTWAEYNQQVAIRIKEKLQEYEQKIRRLAETRGGVHVQSRYSSVNFKWFALHRFAGMSSEKIFKRFELQGDESTVAKGVKAAAKILKMSHRGGKE